MDTPSTSSARVGIDFSQIAGLQDLLTNCPQEMVPQLIDAFGQIGRSDIARLRDSIRSGLKSDRQGFLKAFRYQATDPKQKELSKLFLSEYTKWKPSMMFQTGGTIVPSKSKTLIIRVRDKNGKPLYTTKRIKKMLDTGKAYIANLPSGPAILENKGGTTKTGKYRRGKFGGGAVAFLAFLRPMAKQKKRLNFFENYDQNERSHQIFLEEAVETALTLAANKYGKVGPALRQ